MQTLKQRTKRNTPTNTSQVRGNCDLQLNKEETLSVANLKTCFNNPEVNLPQHTGGLKDVVYVISLDGKKLIQPKDLVWLDGKKYKTIGVQNKGEYVKVEDSKKVFAVKNIEKKYHFGGFSYN